MLEFEHDRERDEIASPEDETGITSEDHDADGEVDDENDGMDGIELGGEEEEE